MVTEEIENQRALPEGTYLLERYRICGVLGEGGFGITYEGTDLKEEKRVAIKEFVPTDYTSRENAVSNPRLFVFHGEQQQFERGLAHFLKEAEALREFQYLDGIVSVLDYFEANGTAYIVMEYIEGITLKQYVKENGCLSYKELVSLLTPIMKAMIQIHKRGVIHRDISPDNLLFGLDNRARLIDFGAVSALGEQREHTKTVILKKGYAPPEQYLVEGKQGPWTDVYAMAATIYMGVTGRTPVDSVARLQGEGLAVEPLQQKALESWQIQAIFTGMELKIAKRYKNLEELLDALTIPPSLEDQPTKKQKELQGKLKFRVVKMNHLRGKGTFLKVFLGVSLVVLFALGVAVWQNSFLHNNNAGETDAKSTQSSTMSTTEQGKLCQMPNVTGKTEKEAMGEIAEMDSVIVIETHTQYSEDVKKGDVIEQSVAAGTQYNEGAIAKVVLTVSKGKKKTEKQEATTTREAVSSQKVNTTKTTEKSNPSSKENKDFKVVEDEDDGYDQFQLGD